MSPPRTGERDVVSVRGAKPGPTLTFVAGATNRLAGGRTPKDFYDFSDSFLTRRVRWNP